MSRWGEMGRWAKKVNNQLYIVDLYKILRLGYSNRLSWEMNSLSKSLGIAGYFNLKLIYLKI